MADLTEIIAKGRTWTKREANIIFNAYRKRMTANAKDIIAYIERLFANNLVTEAQIPIILRRLDLSAVDILADIPAATFGHVNFLEFVLTTLGLKAPSIPDDLRKIVVERTKKGKVPAKYKEFAAQGGNELSKIIADQKKRMINRISYELSRIMTGGADLTESKKLIKSAFAKINSHAKMISVTEFHRVMNTAEYIGVNRTNEIKRFMIATLDDRTRPQSAALDGVEEDSRGEWHYGGHSTKYPGAWGVPEYDINDREVVGYRVSEDTQGGQRAARNLETNQTELTSFSVFEQWARAQGLLVNAYGQKYNFAG